MSPLDDSGSRAGFEYCEDSELTRTRLGQGVGAGRSDFEYCEDFE